MANQTVLEFKKVSKSFGNKTILKDFNISIKKGESFVLIGQSGVGKSVSIKMAVGLLKQDTGSVKMFGQEIADMTDQEILQNNKRISFLFQNSALFDSLNVLENVAFPLTQSIGMEKEKAEKIAIKCLKDVGLSADTAYKKIDELSGGMKKRVALARAIINTPEIIFFDEPTTGLDPIMSDLINDLIIKCVRKIGATAITITHDMKSAEKIADKIGMLYDGKIVWEGSNTEMKKSKNPYIKQFLAGSSKGIIKT